MSTQLATKEYVDKCPTCHKAILSEVESNATYGLSRLNEKNNKLDDKNFITLQIKKCPECGAIFLFEK